MNCIRILGLAAATLAAVIVTALPAEASQSPGTTYPPPVSSPSSPTKTGVEHADPNSSLAVVCVVLFGFVLGCGALGSGVGALVGGLGYWGRFKQGGRAGLYALLGFPIGLGLGAVEVCGLVIGFMLLPVLISGTLVVVLGLLCLAAPLLGAGGCACACCCCAGR